MLRKLKQLIIEKPQTSKLVTDAAPVCDNLEQIKCNNLIRSHSDSNGSNGSNAINAINGNNELTDEIQSNNLEIVHSNGNSMASSINDTVANRGVNETNNNLALQMQNIQGQNVYQFSNCNSLHFGHVVINNSMTQNNQKSPDKSSSQLTGIKRIPNKKIKTTTIAEMMRSDDPLEYNTMNIIAENLGQGWRDIIRQLGFLDGKIEQLHEENYVKGIKEVIYQFLLDWSQSDENATLGRISTLLWRDHWEVVYLLRDYYKANRMKSSASEKSERETFVPQNNDNDKDICC